MPPYVQRILIWYLFCYIIKCFPTLEVVMGVVKTKEVSICPHVHTPPYIWMPPICSESYNRVFILLYHKMFPTLEVVNGVVKTYGVSICPTMFTCPLYASMTPYVWTPPDMFRYPICLDTHLYV